jgi:hypothetical protein
VLLLFLLGFGSPLTFGTANLKINPGAFGARISGVGTVDISLISTVLALLVGVAVVAKAAQKTMEYGEDKEFHRLDLAASGAQPG